MLHKFVDAPDTPTFKLLCLMFTFDIRYIHHSLSFVIRMAKAAAKVKRVSRDITNTGIPNRDLIRSILCRFVYANAKLATLNSRS